MDLKSLIEKRGGKISYYEIKKIGDRDYEIINFYPKHFDEILNRFRNEFPVGWWISSVSRDMKSGNVEFNLNLFGKRFYEIYPENVKIERLHILFDADNLPPRIGIEGTAKQEEFESLLSNSGFGEIDDWYRKKFLQIV